jgi:hypothetical protein
VLGSASGSTPAVGLHRWSNGAAWGQIYRADFARTAVVPSTVTWRGLVATNPAPFVTATRRVRGYVDGGGRLAGPFRLALTGVRLVVVYGILRQRRSTAVAVRRHARARASSARRWPQPEGWPG